MGLGDMESMGTLICTSQTESTVDYLMALVDGIVGIDDGLLCLVTCNDKAL